VSGTTGADVLLDVLRSEGVRHIFGNPGTTELPLMDALAGVDDIRYVLALQEASAAAMADAYAQATGRPSFLNLHTIVGLGNAAGNLANALANNSPIVVTAGQQDERHLAEDPFLSGDLVELARPLTKWAHEVRGPDELGAMLRRAFRDALAPPAGPVFLALRMDHLQRPAKAPPPRSLVDHGAVAGSLDQLVDRLCAVPAGQVALVLGGEVARSGAVEAVAELADALGATAFGAPLVGATTFPAGHPLSGGMLPLTRAEMQTALAPYRVVLALGADPFQAVLHTPEDPVAAGTVVLQLSADPLALGRTFPVQLGLTGDLRATVEALTPLVAARQDADAAAAAREAGARRHAQASERWHARADAGEDADPMDPAAAARAVMTALPPETPLVNEAPTAGAFARAFHAADLPGTYYFARGGGLGWAMPAACGVALARPDAGPVACVVGDGATMYSPQALWTAASLRLPVVFVVLDNRGYEILRDTLDGWQGRSARTGTYVALELDEPRLDFPALAAAMGVPARTARTVTEVRTAVTDALAAGGPHLLHLPIRAPQDAPRRA
jgi:benzoylformate decarboxylase